MNEDLRVELEHMRRRDERTRSRLMESGELFEGYSEEMERLHLENAARLEEILDDSGWPTRSEVGEAGVESAWLVAQHAISRPDLQRRCLSELIEAVAEEEAPAWQVAYLADRIRVNEGRPQIYGTQLDWNAEGELAPQPIEAPAEVDRRRAEVGLVPLAEAVELARRHARVEGHLPPADREGSRERREEWARRVGWIGPE